MNFKYLYIFTFFILSFAARGQNITVETLDQLSFGTFVMGGNSGNVAVNAAGLISATPGIILIGNDAQSARIKVMTNSIVPINITVTADNIYLANGNNQTLLLTPNLIVPQSFIVTAATPAYINVGGTLYVPGSIPGVYTGTLLVEFTQNNQ